MLKNWSIDENYLKKYPEQYARWRLEQRVNFGIGKKRLSRSLLKKYWAVLRIDPVRRRFLDILLHGTGSRDSH
jgi:hypothetical protein